MKRVIIIAVLLGLAAGCNLENKEKILAYRRWHRARAQVICGVGQEQLRVGNLEKALSRAMEAASLDPEFAPARVLLGKVLLEKSQYAKAAEQLLEAERVAPEDAEIVFLLGVSLEKRGQHAEALKRYEQARALDASNDGYLTASAEVLVAMGKPQRALALLEARLDQSDDEPSVLALAGELAMMEGKPAKAVDLFQRYLDLQPDSVVIRENLAKAQFFAGRYADALDVLEKLARDPRYRDRAGWLYVMIGDSHMALGRPDPARSAYETAAVLQPEASPVWVRLAKAAVAMDNCPRAIAAARQALAMTDRCLEATAVLGYAMLRQGQIDQATALLASAARENPGDATIQCMLGRCYWALGQKQRAVSCYKRALECDPDSRLARRLLAAGK
jgi:protein O-GlcNAc transferase